MEPAFWLDKWASNEIGFHRDRPHQYLPLFAAGARARAARRVFVPLCGKSLDMVALHEQGFEVVGVELSERALVDFARENALAPVRRDDGALTVFEAPGYTFYCGDFFRLQARHLAGVDAIYDRAALVALPPATRADYAERLQSLCADAWNLTVTLEYPAHQMQGPPFSVSAADITGLYGERRDIELLDRADILADEPHFVEKGLTELHECAYALSPRPAAGS